VAIAASKGATMDDPMNRIIAAVFALAAYVVAQACFGAWLAGQKGRPTAEGVLLAIVLGPVGWFVELLLPNGWDGPED
jgi:hypothetical protein